MENEERQFPHTSKFFQWVEGELSLNTRDILYKEQHAEALFSSYLKDKLASKLS